MRIARPAFLSARSAQFLTWVCVLSLLGTVFVFEASVAEALATFGDQWHVVRQHITWLAIGWTVLGVTWLVPSSFWKKTSLAWYVVPVFMLILVLIPGIGKEVNGARRWLMLGSYRFQPVEVLKLGMILFYAEWLTRHQKLGTFLLLTMLPVGLLLLQPDLGSALIVMAIAFGMYVIAGARWKTITLLAVGGIFGLTAIIVLSPYRLQRVTTYLNPEADPLGSSFHVRQLTLALGNGGLFGQGIGRSKQKYSYLPEASTDSIFAIVAEEVGFVGSLAIIAVFWLWLRSAARIAKRLAVPSYEYFLAQGIWLWCTAQTVLNLAAVVALVPLTGIPLPFFSYGGTALVILCAACGILAGLARQHHHSNDSTIS